MRRLLVPALGLAAALLAGCGTATAVADDAAADPAAVTAAPGSPAAATTAAAATTGPAPRPKRERRRIVVSGTGDVNLDPDYLPALRTEGYDHAWSGLEGLFGADDLTVVNLECPVSTRGTIVPKQFNFRCDPAALPAARAAGVEVANLANNHSGDYGPVALLDSVELLRAAGIAPVGVGADAAAAGAPAVVEVGGWTVAVLGFGGVVPAADWLATDTRPGMADGDDTAAMTEAVRLADEGADLVFVSIHWGEELDVQPQPDDVERARAMIDAGADGVFGHHSHRLQPLGEHAGRPIAWGLGNFVWPRRSPAGARTAVAQFVVEPDGSGGVASVTGCLLPADIVTSGHPVLTGARSCARV